MAAPLQAKKQMPQEKPKVEELSLDDQFEDLLEAPTLPDDSAETAEDMNNITIDIQKELEEKFDELFGAFEDDETSQN